MLVALGSAFRLWESCSSVRGWKRGFTKIQYWTLRVSQSSEIWVHETKKKDYTGAQLAAALGAAVVQHRGKENTEKNTTDLVQKHLRSEKPLSLADPESALCAGA